MDNLELIAENCHKVKKIDAFFLALDREKVSVAYYMNVIIYTKEELIHVIYINHEGVRTEVYSSPRVAIANVLDFIEAQQEHLFKF